MIGSVSLQPAWGHDMATIASSVSTEGRASAAGIDRWIFVFMAVWFIAIVLTGFIPDSLARIAAIEAGQRPPFPLAAHAHAISMGSFLLLLLAQSSLMALGKDAYHRQLGMAAFVIVPAMIIAGFILAPTLYHLLWGAMQAAPPEAKAEAEAVIAGFDNIVLLQLRAGILFAIFVTIGLRARKTDAGMHKRMMFLSVAPALPAAFDRMAWLWTTLPETPVGPDVWTVFAILPMLAWDVVRNGRIHRAYWLWFGISAPFALFVHSAWDTPWWHETARALMGV